MALLNTYTSTNQVVSEGLVVKYSIEHVTLVETATAQNPDDPSGPNITVKVDLSYYRCIRYATKRYSFVAMDYTTALACAAAKVAKYTRAYSQIVVDTSTTPAVSAQTSTLCSSDIAPRREGDSAAYSVEISVNEVDEKPSLTIPSNVASLFTAENARDYD